MNVTCPSCATVYRVDPMKVPEAGVRARCKVCSAIFPVTREGEHTARHSAPVAAPTAARISQPDGEVTAPRAGISLPGRLFLLWVRGRAAERPEPHEAAVPRA